MNAGSEREDRHGLNDLPNKKDDRERKQWENRERVSQCEETDIRDTNSTKLHTYVLRTYTRQDAASAQHIK